MRWLLALIVQLASFVAAAQDTVRFASFDAGDDRPATELTGYLFKPNRAGPTPAVIFLHGCGGLIYSISHRIMSREMDWAGRLTAQGYAVLMIDSFTPRGSGEECSRTGFKEWIYLRRPADAYGGLAWLQQQPFVARDRIALIGWSTCKEVVDRAVARGAPITWQAYPGAWHDFDWPNLKRKELPAYTTRDGVVPVTGEDPASHADAIQRVQGFLAQHIAVH